MLSFVTSDSDHDGTPMEALDTVESLLLRVAEGDQSHSPNSTTASHRGCSASSNAC